MIYVCTLSLKILSSAHYFYILVIVTCLLIKHSDISETCWGKFRFTKATIIRYRQVPYNREI